jgi:hypothetical protein
MSHASFEILHQKILDVEKEIPTGSKWVHFKDQKAEHPYLVLKLALDEESEEVVVIYRREDRPENFCWSRPVSGEKGWLSTVEVDGKHVKRFKKIS